MAASTLASPSVTSLTSLTSASPVPSLPSSAPSVDGRNLRLVLLAEGWEGLVGTGGGIEADCCDIDLPGGLVHLVSRLENFLVSIFRELQATDVSSNVDW